MTENKLDLYNEAVTLRCLLFAARRRQYKFTEITDQKLAWFLRSDLPITREYRDYLATRFEKRKKQKNVVREAEIAFYIWKKHKAKIQIKSAVDDALTEFKLSKKSRSMILKIWARYKPIFEFDPRITEGL
jgi:hypothetical protein